jgi:hypothetical protein
MKIITIEEKSMGEIYQLVLDFYKSHSPAYPDEVADTISLELRTVMEVVDK